MGGSAFTSQGLDAQRLEQAEYDALQARVLPLLQNLYAHVQVPRSAPEKTSHGDLDVFAMAHGLSRAAEVVAQRLGAVAFIESKPTSNYALPTDEEGKIHQVDVHECATQAEWDVGMLMHEFGDLGMMLGKLAGGCGDDVVLGAYGLRVCGFALRPLDEV